MEIRPIFSALMRNKVAPVLVAMQVAISLAILANALHIVTLRYEMATRPSGVADEANSFYIDFNPVKDQPFEASIAQQKRDRQALLALPGVTAAAVVSQLPMNQSGWNSSVATDRKQIQPLAEAAMYLSPDPMIDAMGLELVEGRNFNDGDIVEMDLDQTEPANGNVVITQALAQKLFPDATSVTGKTMLIGTGDDAWETHIVGVVKRLQTPGSQASIEGEYSVIRPIRSTMERAAEFFVRTAPGQRDRVMREAEALLPKITPYAGIVKAVSMEEVRSKRYRNDRILGWMLIAVSVFLMLITASGVVGMTSLWISQRRKQIGVRRALGARRLDILRYFITENILITTGGVVAGLIMALALNQYLVSRLEMERLPITYLAVGALAFWLLGVLSVYGPAWRAASISPAVATRTA
jgi:putative ABC transport system permease protein